jgi:hypothetical protein
VDAWLHRVCDPQINERISGESVHVIGGLFESNPRGRFVVILQVKTRQMNRTVETLFEHVFIGKVPMLNVLAVDENISPLLWGGIVNYVSVQTSDSVYLFRFEGNEKNTMEIQLDSIVLNEETTENAKIEIWLLEAPQANISENWAAARNNVLKNRVGLHFLSLFGSPSPSRLEQPVLRSRKSVPESKSHCQNGHLVIVP